MVNKVLFQVLFFKDKIEDCCKFKQLCFAEDKMKYCYMFKQLWFVEDKKRVVVGLNKGLL